MVNYELIAAIVIFLIVCFLGTCAIVYRPPLRVALSVAHSTEPFDWGELIYIVFWLASCALIMFIFYIPVHFIIKYW